MTSQADVEVVRDVFDAFIRRDRSALDRLFDDDVVFYLCANPPFSGERRGKKACFEHLKQLAEYSGETWRLIVEDIVASDSGVVVLLTSETERDGKTSASKQVHVAQVDGGKLTELRQYLSDPATGFWEQ